MRKKPKWWALILALVILAGSGFTMYKFHRFGGRGFDGFYGMHGSKAGFGMMWDDDRSYSGRMGHKGMMGNWDKDWDDDWDRGHGMGRGFQYKMSDEDLEKTPDVYAKDMATTVFGEEITVEPLKIAEQGVMAYQVMKDEALVQIIIVDTEEEVTSFMFR